MSRERFVELIQEGLVLLPQHIKVLQRVCDDPEAPEQAQVLAAGSLVHWLAGANTIPGVRGLLAYVDDLLVMRLAQGRLGVLAPEVLERQFGAAPEISGSLEDDVAVIREQLAGSMAVFEQCLDRIGELKHMGRTANECVLDDAAATMLYEEVLAGLAGLDLEDSAVSRALKGLDQALAGLSSRRP